MLGLSALCELPLCDLGSESLSARALAELYGGNIFTAKSKKKSPLPEEPDPIVEPLVYEEEELTEDEIPLPFWLDDEVEEEDEEAKIRRKLLLRTWYWYNRAGRTRPSGPLDGDDRSSAAPYLTGARAAL